MIIVSACLSGEKCRYDCGTKENAAVRDLVSRGRAVAVCPELLAGFGLPRPASEISGGNGADVLAGKARVLDMKGKDITVEFVDGCRKAAERGFKEGVRLAVLKEKSAACGTKKIYDGSFKGRLVRGPGILCALLEAAGIRVISEEDLSDLEISDYE